MKLSRTNLIVTAIVSMFAIAPLAAEAQTVNHRLHDQHLRIHQGIRSHELTRREAHIVRHDDRVIHAREHLDRLTHRGRLTMRERASLRRQLNRNSKRIYRLKHNGVVR